MIVIINFLIWMNPNRQIRLPAPQSPSHCPPIFFEDLEDASPKDSHDLHDPLQNPIDLGDMIPSERGGWHDRSQRSALLSIGSRSIRDSMMSVDSMRSIHHYFLQNMGAGEDLMEGLFQTINKKGQEKMEEEVESDACKILERKILKKQKLITRLLRLRIKAKLFTNKVKVVMNFHKLHLKDRISSKLSEMPDIIYSETDMLETIIRKEMSKTEIDLEILKHELKEKLQPNNQNNLLDNLSQINPIEVNLGHLFQLHQDQPNFHPIQDSLSFYSNPYLMNNLHELNPNLNQLDPKPNQLNPNQLNPNPNLEQVDLNRANLNEPNANQFQRLYGLDGLDGLNGFDDYLFDLESDINSEASLSNFAEKQEDPV